MLALAVANSAVLMPVTPHAISRLVLPSYSSEHLLELTSEDDGSDCRLPVLLRFSEGTRLEDWFRTGKGASGVPLGVECIARKSLFESVAGKALAPWDLVGVSDGCEDLCCAVFKDVERNGFVPQVVLLRLEAELYTGGGGVTRYREEYASNARQPAGPPPLRLGELVATLTCDSASPCSGDGLAIQLDGPGEAVLFSAAGRLPMLISSETWEARSCAADALPELQQESRLLARPVLARASDE